MMFAVARFLLALAVALVLVRLAFELATPMVADVAEALGVTTAEAWRMLVLGAALLVQTGVRSLPTRDRNV